MEYSKSSTVEMLEQIPFRGRDVDSNYYVYCKCCDKRQRLWYRSARDDMKERMLKGLEGEFDCPGCLLKKGVTKSVVVLGRIPVSQAIQNLFMMSKSTGIDYAKADKEAEYQTKMDRQLEEDRRKTEWYLKQMQN